MTDKNTPKSPSPAPSDIIEAEAKTSVKGAKNNTPLYGFVTFIVITGAALVVWQGGHYETIKEHLPALPEINIPSLTSSSAVSTNTVSTAPTTSSEEISRFRIVKQELTELRTSHEALARNFIELQKEFEAYKTKTPEAPAPIAEAAPAQAPAVTEVPTPVVVATPVAPSEAVTAEIAALNARIDTLQKALDGHSGVSQTRLRLLETTNAIAAKLNNGQPYQEDLKELKAVVGSESLPRASIFTLQQHAEQGAPSLSDLTGEFEELARLAVPASLTQNTNATFGDKLRATFGNLITIRKVEVEADDTSDEADIARAEAELRAGNVEMATTHLNQLSDGSKATFKPWMVKANTYLDTRAALTTVREIWLPVSQPAAPTETE